MSKFLLSTKKNIWFYILFIGIVFFISCNKSITNPQAEFEGYHKLMTKTLKQKVPYLSNLNFREKIFELLLKDRKLTNDYLKIYTIILYLDIRIDCFISKRQTLKILDHANIFPININDIIFDFCYEKNDNDLLPTKIGDISFVNILEKLSFCLNNFISPNSCRKNIDSSIFVLKYSIKKCLALQYEIGRLEYKSLGYCNNKKYMSYVFNQKFNIPFYDFDYIDCFNKYSLFCCPLFNYCCLFYHPILCGLSCCFTFCCYRCYHKRYFNIFDLVSEQNYDSLEKISTLDIDFDKKTCKHFNYIYPITLQKPKNWLKYIYCDKYRL